MASTIVHLLLPGGRQRPRDMTPSERFPPLLEHDVLFSAHRNYQTPANQAYRALRPTRSLNLNIEAEVKRPLHEKLQEMIGPNVPAPTFWIGDDKVRSPDHIKSDTSRTFAIGRFLHRCYTVHEATDEGIKAEILRNGSRGELPEILDVSETNTSADETRNTLIANANMSLTLDGVDLESAVASLPISTIANANMSLSYSFTTNTSDGVDLESAVARLPISTIAATNMSLTYCFTTNTLDSFDLESAMATLSILSFVQTISVPSVFLAMSTNSTGSSTCYLQWNRWTEEVCNTSQILVLKGQNLSNLNVAMISSCLKINATLQELEISDNILDQSAMSSLADALMCNSTLDILILDGNNIDATGASTLAAAIEQNASLAVLYLIHNDIGCHGASEIARALRTNSKLSRVDLDDNDIGDAGAMALGDALQQNANLDTLNLGTNAIGSVGVNALATALLQNFTLRKLNLHQNNIGVDCVAELVHDLLNSPLELAARKESVDSVGLELRRDFHGDVRAIWRS